jgi:uncharacterized protein (TIGR00369 family)
VSNAEEWNERGRKSLPGLIGIEILEIEPDGLTSKLDVRSELLAPNGYLHAATVVALADTTCGYGAWNILPEKAHGFTTIELKSNFVGTAREGSINCEASLAHRGGTIQLWDARVTEEGSDRLLALFRCTQMILYPRDDKGRLAHLE